MVVHQQRWPGARTPVVRLAERDLDSAVGSAGAEARREVGNEAGFGDTHDRHTKTDSGEVLSQRDAQTWVVGRRNYEIPNTTA